MEGYYTGEYQNKSLEKVMDGISFASEFNYKIINKNELIIYKKPWTIQVKKKLAISDMTNLPTKE